MAPTTGTQRKNPTYLAALCFRLKRTSAPDCQAGTEKENVSVEREEES